MVRKIKLQYRSPINGELAVLECDHVAKIGPTTAYGFVLNLQKNGFKVRGIFCDNCNQSLLLPDTLAEIQEKYWDGRPARF